MTQDYIQGPPMVTCANGHPCNQYVTTCRICGAPVTNQSYQPPQRQESPPAYQPPPPGVAYRPAAAPVYRGPLPSVWPTVLVTFFFGIFGLIPASMHTSRAREAGRPTNTYWAAFGWTMAASILLWVLFLVVIASSVHTTTYYYPSQ